MSAHDHDRQELRDAIEAWRERRGAAYRPRGATADQVPAPAVPPPSLDVPTTAGAGFSSGAHGEPR
jgi:hypothetical protein